MDKEELIRILKKHPAREAIALEVLGKDAVAWHRYRKKAHHTRLIDPETGQWLSEFEAGGKKYYIRSPEDGLSLYRYTKLKQMLAEVGFDAGYAEQLAKVNELIEHANSLVTKAPRLDKLFAGLDNMRLAIQQSSRQWDRSFMAATLFVVTDGEDLTMWDERLAEQKIQDWNEAQFHPQDFFLLAMFWASLATQELNESWRKIKAIIQQVSK